MYNFKKFPGVTPPDPQHWLGGEGVKPPSGEILATSLTAVTTWLTHLTECHFCLQLWRNKHFLRFKRFSSRFLRFFIISKTNMTFNGFSCFTGFLEY